MAGAGRAVVGVPTLGVCQGEPAHELGEFTILVRPEQDVEVVRHQAVGQQSHVVPCDGFGENTLKGDVVLVAVEDGQPGIGSVEGVVHEAALRCSSWSRHRPRVRDQARRVKIGS